MSESNRKILQIIPADGWWVGFNGTTPTSITGGFTGFSRLTCWALVEKEDGETEVVGMEGDGDTEIRFADINFAFDKYLYFPDSDPNEEKK